MHFGTTLWIKNNQKKNTFNNVESSRTSLILFAFMRAHHYKSLVDGVLEL